MPAPVASRPLPPVLESLRALAADLRWTWTHSADHLWRRLDPERWADWQNPWLVLRDTPQDNIDRAAADPSFVADIERAVRLQRAYLARKAWFASIPAAARPRRIAFFSMEFGLSESLPLYAGGLGVLAGDYLKTASDLAVPVLGIGLLYQEGYFRQTVDADGNQHELYPYNDPAALPISPLCTADGRWRHVELEFPGRTLRLRVWQGVVGRARLYLLDSNDAANSPADRAITAKLYDDDATVRLLQEIVLGIGGWRLVDAIAPDVDVCHLNEGHAALAVLERTRCFMDRMKVRGTPASFEEAFWAVRGGNVFTTHTAVSAAFDRFDPSFLDQQMPFLRQYASDLGVSFEDMLALGRSDPANTSEPFNLAYLAMRGSASTNAVSASHEGVSRRLFTSLFPRWPELEIPIGHVTNGVHAPSWDSPAADRLWETHCGKDRWLGDLVHSARAIAAVPDDRLWAARTEARASMVTAVRRRLARQLATRGVASDAASAARVFDPAVLTLGFARRFTSYKRPTLLLSDEARLARLLGDARRPVQLVVAGKAHPADAHGKEDIRKWVRLAQDDRFRNRLVFLEDYDITLAQELVAGVDVWLNTPSRPWEACGTSGMKVLVNGGLNLSELDGWWSEAYSPAVGWAIGNGNTSPESESDAADAEQMYALLEHEVVPEFYTRDARGLPVRWLARIRTSMSELAPRFSANRMVREYVESHYIPAARRFAERSADGARLARELAQWSSEIHRAWDTVVFGPLVTHADERGIRFVVSVELGRLDPSSIRVELYADATDSDRATFIPMHPLETPCTSAGCRYEAFVETRRPADHYTPRVVPAHAHASVPAEVGNIRWQR
jgi:starch phosphorylase